MKKIVLTVVFLLQIVFLLRAEEDFINHYSQVRTLQSGQKVIDVVVSLYRTPNFQDRLKYEEIIGAYADAVYEATNGGHYIGNVYFFQNGARSDIADIIWTQNAFPAGTRNGFLRANYYISVGDTWGTSTITDFFVNSKSLRRLGQVISHEHGHFVYGLGDEYARGELYSEISEYYYNQLCDNIKKSEDLIFFKEKFILNSSTGKYEVDDTKLSSAEYTRLSDIMKNNGFLYWMPHFGDTIVTPSIMGSTINALEGNLGWLNFSTINNYDLNNSQGRLFGKSQWDVLSEHPNNDPVQAVVTVGLDRYDFSGLASYAPKSTDYYTIDATYIPYIKAELNDPNHTPRAHLNVYWMADAFEMVLVLDNSSSMAGAPLEKMKAAAKNLIDIMELNKTSVGIVTFASDVNRLSPMIHLAAEADKTHLKELIDGIDLAGQTALFAGAQEGLDMLNEYVDPVNINASRMAIVISDGANNIDNGPTLKSVVDNYKKSYVPINGIYYHEEVPGYSSNILEMAKQTGGEFADDVADNVQLELAFRDFYAEASNWTSMRTYAPGPGVMAARFVVDSTVSQLKVHVNYTSSAGAADFNLTDAGGNPVSYSRKDITSNGGAVLSVLSVDQSEFAQRDMGTWQVSKVGNTAVTDFIADVKVKTAGESYVLRTGLAKGKNITYPEPILLTANLSKSEALTGYNITAAVTSPSGAVIHISLSDYGTNGDLAAGDGMYSGILPTYNENGRYTYTVLVNNADGKASTATNFAYPLQPDGTPYTPEKKYITENFDRSKTMTFYVSGVGQGQVNVLQADNTRVNGIIETAGAANTYSVVGIDKSKALYFRVFAFGNGMEPVLTIYGDNQEIVKVNQFIHSSKNGYIYYMLSPELLNQYTDFTVKVEHLNPAHAKGIYQIKAGPEIYGDTPGQGTVLFNVETKDHHLGDSNIAVYSFKVENKSGYTLNNVELYYYFTADNGAEPTFLDYYTPDCDVRLEEINPLTGEYALILHYDRLLPGEHLPAGLENQVHVRHTNYEPMNKENDFSNNRPMPWENPWPFSVLFEKNEQVAVYAELFGKKMMIYGSKPE